MKKKAIYVVLASLIMSSASIPVYANALENTAPSTETTINGVPESKANNMQTRDVIARTFYSYQNNVHSTVTNYKLIGTFRHDNRYSPNNATMTATVTKSSSQGSDWSFSAGIGGEFKVNMLAALKADVGYNYKQSRSSNEAVGYSISSPVSAGKVGYINLYYQGEKIGGVAKYKQFNTANPSNYIYVTEDVNATVYDKDVLAINSKYYEKNS